MVKVISNIRFVNPEKIPNLSDEEYLFIRFNHRFELLYKVVEKDKHIGVYDNMFYVFDDDGELIFKVDIKNIESIFAYMIGGGSDD